MLAAMKKLTNSLPRRRSPQRPKAGPWSVICSISILPVFSAINCAWAAADLPAGSAKGSFTYEGATAELKFAAAFVDQTDERKPIVLLISEQKRPVEKWIREGFLLLPSNF
jgi:hypothetical protein